MKILPVALIREADAHTIATEPITGIDLMERAAAMCFIWLQPRITTGRTVHVFCGTGNNGGDGFAVARMLEQEGHNVKVYALGAADRMSPDCRKNFERLPCPVTFLTDEGALPKIEPGDIVIDAIFGNGLTRPPDGLAGSVIRGINGSGATVVAIDVPSGLFTEISTVASGSDTVIRADYTLTFSPPKYAFFFPENETFCGEWHLLDIGLSPEFIASAAVKNHMLTAGDVAPILKRRGKFSHKGTFGHSLLIAGSAGKAGAAVLAARACLRAGAGLVTMRVPGVVESVVQTAVPEAMLVTDPDPAVFSALPDLSPYSSIGIGPGLGTTPVTAGALKLLIQEARRPLVLDADALNILAENRTWLGFLPQGSILTPHPKEFERLAGKTANDFERNERQRELSARTGCYIILKGAHTAITSPDGICRFNTTGNPGMATGGSGDVLTGLLTGLLAQGYTPLESTLLGVYIHGLAGDFALADKGFEALIASDIIENLGKSFQSLYGKF